MAVPKRKPQTLTERPILSSPHTVHEEPLLLNLTFHRLGLILSGTFALIATLISSWLIFQHARHYARPHEQRHIIRILLMIPIYSIVSFLSFEFYRHFIYFQVVRDCYEAIVIASFFALLCHYIAPNLHDQKDRFRVLSPRDWIWPVSWFRRCCCCCCAGVWRTPRSGLTWFNVCVERQREREHGTGIFDIKDSYTDIVWVLGF